MKVTEAIGAKDTQTQQSIGVSSGDENAFLDTPQRYQRLSIADREIEAIMVSIYYYY